jgi:hypothetical protein
MVTVPLSPSQVTAHLQHPSNGQLGLGRGGGYYPKQQAHHPHAKKDNLLVAALDTSKEFDLDLDITQGHPDHVLAPYYYAALEELEDSKLKPFEDEDPVSTEDDKEGRSCLHHLLKWRKPSWSKKMVPFPLLLGGKVKGRFVAQQSPIQQT